MSTNQNTVKVKIEKKNNLFDISENGREVEISEKKLKSIKAAKTSFTKNQKFLEELYNQDLKNE